MKICFDTDWKFQEGDLPPVRSTDDWGGAKARAYSGGVPSENYDDSKWRTVELPHDFVSEKEYCFQDSDSAKMCDIPEMESIGSRLFAGGCLEGGVAWYRKKFRTDDSFCDKRVYIHFDGVYRNSTLYCNQYYVGTHAGGYAGFYYDITDFLNIGEENLIAMRVDASDREGWWYEGGGIYRHVWLEVVDNVHVEPWSISVQAVPDLEENTAALKIEMNIVNRFFEEKNVRAELEILDPEGSLSDKMAGDVLIGAWDIGCCVKKTVLENVSLWNLDTPRLYTLVLRLFTMEETKEGKTVTKRFCDEYKTEFGIRDFRFDHDRGFFLNGQHVKIKGLCCHQDHAGVGIGIPDSVNEYRLAQMKGMGANAIRSSHYPASPQFLEACDRMGMLVFEETRRMSSAPEDLEYLKAMVKRDRNHPSIFLWGIGNEEIFSQHRPETAGTTRTMMAKIKKLDPTRPVTSAVVCWDGTKRYDNAEIYVDVTKYLDVMGFNYCASAWDDYHRRVPQQPVIITEATSNSGTRGCYSTDEGRGLYCVLDEENACKCKSGAKAEKKDAGEEMWKMCAEREYLAGIFLWTGMDYRGEPTPLGYPAVYSQFGIFDYCGFPKDNYYYYKSWWQEERILRLLPHWNHPGSEGQKLRVYCYSNLDEVELFVNGRSYGRKQMEKNWYITWEDVVYEPGQLKAVGYQEGKSVKEALVHTTKEPFRIRLTPYRDEVKTGETAIINVDILDEDGVFVPDADREIRFQIGDGGILLGTGNGNPGSHESEKLSFRRSFHGKCQLLVKVVRAGEIEISAVSEGLAGGMCTLTVSKCEENF